MVGLIFLAFAVQAQEDGAKLAKSAGKALTSYNMDPTSNSAKLEEAKQKIDQALNTAEGAALASAWITKGDIYSTVLEKDAAKRMIDPNAKYTGDNDALIAAEAYLKALELTQKKFDKADAIKGLSGAQGHLINIGVTKYEAGEYEKAFNSFRTALKSHEALKAANEKSVLDDPAQYDNQVFITALAAQLAGNNKDAASYYENLYRKGTTNPSVYEGLYTTKTALGDEAGALKVLEEGRAKFPDDTGLLFAEINVYLKSGKLDQLVLRLQKAIEKEPNNIGLYITLGSVYDNLYQRELTAKNQAKADEYFEMARKNYTDGIAKDPKNVDAQYALGALYYNKAALRTQELNAMPEDFSSAGIKKYDAFKKEIMGLFDQALPYFQKAESLDPNDMNTLIALNEIYARKEDELSLEFKKRLDVVKAGGKNPTSHFK